MEYNALLDLLIRHRRWVVAVVIAAIVAFAYWLAVTLARRAGVAPAGGDRAAHVRVPPLDVVLTHTSRTGDVVQTLLWLVTLGAASLDRLKA